MRPSGSGVRGSICCVGAPRRCYHIACVAPPCICPRGARNAAYCTFTTGCERSSGMRAASFRSNPCRPCFSGAPTAIAPASRHTLADSRPVVHTDILGSLRIISKSLRHAAGGSLGSKGSWAFERGLSRCCRMRSTTRGSVIKDRMRIRPPQGKAEDRSRRFPNQAGPQCCEHRREQSESSCAGMLRLPATRRSFLHPQESPRRIRRGWNTPRKIFDNVFPDQGDEM